MQQYQSSAILKKDLEDQSKRSQEAFDRIIAQSTALYDDIKQHQKSRDEAWKRQDEAWKESREEDRKMWAERG